MTVFLFNFLQFKFCKNLLLFLIQVSGSLAEASGQLVQGDQIIKVNEIDLEKANQV